MIQQLSTVFVLICITVQSAVCYDASTDVQSLLWQPTFMASLVSICSIISIIIVLVACTKWCPRETAEFKVVFIAPYY